MRIIINLDTVRDTAHPSRKTIRVRTNYYFSDGDELRVKNCGVEIYNIIKDGFGRGFEGGLIIHEGEKK